MAKAKSPVRLQEETMRAAERDGKLYNRTQAQQLEYWIKLGRQVADILDAKTLMDVRAGFATLSVQSTSVPDINPDEVFADLEKAQEAEPAQLSDAMADHSKIRYQASKDHPGMLERVNAKTGQTVLGYFLNGEFIPAGGDGDGKRVADLGR